MRTAMTYGLEFVEFANYKYCHINGLIHCFYVTWKKIWTFELGPSVKTTATESRSCATEVEAWGYESLDYKTTSIFKSINDREWARIRYGSREPVEPVRLGSTELPRGLTILPHYLPPVSGQFQISVSDAGIKLRQTRFQQRANDL